MGAQGKDGHSQVMRVMLVVLSTAVLVEGIALWRVTTRTSQHSTETNLQLCESLRATVQDLASPSEAHGMKGDYAMGMFRGAVTPPMLQACGIDFNAVAGDFKRAEDCYIGTGSAACVVDAAAHVSTLLK